MQRDEVGRYLYRLKSGGVHRHLKMTTRATKKMQVRKKENREMCEKLNIFISK